MPIKVAQDEEVEPHAANALDDHFTTPYTAYDVLHSLIHRLGIEEVEEGLKLAFEDKDRAVNGALVELPPVHIPLSLVSEALERFKATHSEAELKEAAKGAQEYFGGRIGKVLHAILESAEQEENPDPPSHGKNLH